MSHVHHVRNQTSDLIFSIFDAEKDVGPLSWLKIDFVSIVLVQINDVILCLLFGISN